MPRTFEYDAFISYKSEDKGWADRLRLSLEARSLGIYQDINLRGGQQWHPQLIGALNASRHIVVVWSAHAAQKSGWVEDEMYHFLHQCHQPAPPDDPRRLIFVRLDNEEPGGGFRQFHARVELHKAGVALGDANSAPATVWDRLIDQLHGDLTALPGDRTVPVVVLASKRTYFESVDLTQSRGFGHTLDHVLQSLNLKVHGAVAPAAYEPFFERYGLTREEWHPFGRKEASVADMLKALEADVNKTLLASGQRPIRLIPVDDSFWGQDVCAMQRVTKELASGHALVVIDPLSLYDPYIGARVDRMSNCFTSRRSAVVMLGPFGLGGPGSIIKDHVQAMATMAYEHFFEPAELPATGFSPSAANVSDLSQIKRYLLLALGGTRPAASRQKKHPYVNYPT